MTSVLYDVPGPRAVRRNRLIGVVVVVVVAAIVGFFVWRLIATGQFTAEKWYIFTFGTIWALIGEATLRTVGAFAVAAVGALVLGFVLAIGRMSDHRWVRVPVGAIVEVLRAIPVLIFMFLLYYGLPVLGIRMPSYWAVVLALIVYNGSVLAEVIRAGVESLPRGQREAGYAIGLRKSGVMRLVLLPQAIRAMMPVIIAQLVVTLKDTALGFIITYPELLFLARQLGSQATYDSPIVPSTIVAAAIYIALCLLLSSLATLVEKRLRRGGRTPAVASATAAKEGTDTELLLQQRGGVTDARTGNAGGSQTSEPSGGRR